MEPKRGRADVNGTTLYYEDTGQGHPVVLVHGHTVDSRMWDEQVGPLASKYRVIRYDARGYGRSAVPVSKDYAHTDDLRALLDHLEVSRAHVIGLSMGGLIAVDFALAYPEAVASLVAVDAVLGGYRWEEAGKIIRTVHRTALKHGVEAAKAAWLGSELFAPTMEKAEAAAGMRDMVAGYTGWHWLNRAPIRGNDPPAIDRLGEIACPTLAIVGERDMSDFRIIADILSRGIPGARQVVLAGAGHMANMEAPSKFNRAVADFLAEVERE